MGDILLVVLRRASFLSSSRSKSSVGERRLTTAPTFRKSWFDSKYYKSVLEAEIEDFTGVQRDLFKTSEYIWALARRRTMLVMND
jgi:hypothetical protein